MPEMPEVETCALKLRELCLGRTIADVAVDRNPKRYLGTYPRSFGDPLSWLIDRRITGVSRAGKVIVIELAGELYLTSHLGMSGYWDSMGHPWTFDYVEGRREPSERDVRVRIGLEGPGQHCDILWYHDSRMFGALEGWDEEGLRQRLEAVGPELVETGLSRGRNVSADVVELAGRVLSHAGRRPIKEAIMDQRVVAGIGNIYATEALWIAGVRPDASVSSLGGAGVQDVLRAADAAMRFSLERRIDYSALWVYGRRDCPACRVRVERYDVAGRTSHRCPSCQP